MRTICFLFAFFFFQQLKAQTIQVTGEVTKKLTLTKEDLAKMNRTTVTAKDKDGKDHTYKGVAIAEILTQAGVTTGAQLRGENLSKYLLVTCADGYAVVFSLAELDAAFTDKVVILADESDGQPLPADRGPWRIVVPGEKKPARSCYRVTTLNVGVAK
ncbi:molybdopterin-dependent oxidoreductase [Chitinophaga sancti]|uniref:molybdopterin-dependent oxidoreductase n=1 Tax=Chitinophaga sancti TaxID=1004 RepID=UPI002A7485F4|nr:molybdopterin-dependent oxidoreductase [Chitinophaga sancti]WPQ60704.1 molybdopterin-dependent oxidoreductase [Chitinophaga sancti]